MFKEWARALAARSLDPVELEILHLRQLLANSLHDDESFPVTEVVLKFVARQSLVEF